MDTSIENAIRENLEYCGNTGQLIWKNNMGRNLVKGKVAGSKNTKGYFYVKVARRTILLHRIVWYLHYGKWPVNEIDHIDGDKHNNKIQNLRDVTRRINQGNQKTHRAGRLVGTTFLKTCPDNPWQAQIELNRKSIYLGCFQTEEEAHAAYVKAYEEWARRGV